MTEPVSIDDARRRHQSTAVARVPPHDLQAEASVLGAMLLDRRAIETAVETLDAADFYSPGHGHVFEAIRTLFSSGQPSDTTTVAAELARAKVLEQAGGPAILITLQAGTPSYGNAARYVRIVADHALKRRLIKMASDIADIGYDPGSDAREAVDAAEQLVYAQRPQDSVGPEGHGLAVLGAEWREHVAELVERGGEIDSPMGWVELDEALGGLHPGRVIVVGARPGMGKTSWATSLAANVAGTGRPVLVVSAEMSRLDVYGRMMAAASGLVGSDLDRGRVNLRDWALVDAGAEKLSRLPVDVIDTTPVTVLSLRTWVRRAISHYGSLGLVVIDYLQLMSGRRRAENRQVEVAEMSRDLKLMAGELRVPIVVLCQLSRGVEARSDKRPTLVDLRECVTGDTLIYDPATGEQRRISDMARLGNPAAVVSLNSAYRLLPYTATTAWESGVKPVFRVRTRTGREIRATANHPFLTIDGWRRLDSIQVGTEVATPRRLPCPDDPGELHPDRARLLGYLLSDGSYAKHRSVSFTSNDPVVLADALRIGQEQFGISARLHPHWSGTPSIEFTVAGAYGPNKNPLIQWLKEIGIHGDLTALKHAPDIIFRAGAEPIANFVAGLYVGDGSIISTTNDRRIVKLTSTSRQLLRDAQHLLLRLGVISSITRPTRHSKSTIDIADLVIRGKEQIGRFAEVIRLVGCKQQRLIEVRGWSEIQGRHHGSSSVTDACLDSTDDRPSTASRSRLCFRRFHTCATELQRSWSSTNSRSPHSLPTSARSERDLGTSDLLWDRVEAIDPVGEEMTYDLHVPGHHNFVANDFVVHNSGAPENDADAVILIYRDEMYNPQSPDRGVAELGIPKNRFGPLGVVRLHADLPRHRWSDLSLREAI